MWKMLMLVSGWCATLLACLVISGMFFYLGLWIGSQILE